MMEPAGVPVEFVFFPEKLSALGYSTYMVGKWHLGYCKYDFLPTKRGFEKFHGYYGPSEDYYKHTKQQFDPDVTGLDFSRDTPVSFTADWSKQGDYSTEVFVNDTIELLQNHTADKPFFIYLASQAVHEPLDPPPSKYMDGKCMNITVKDRQIYCGMLNALDDAVGRIVAELQTLDLYKDTIIVFGSDNGGDTKCGGNNYPLRGNKNTLWEGGTRVNSFVHSPANIDRFAVRTQMFSIVDWYATVLGMAGEAIDEYGDGYNQWEMIKSNSSKNNRQSFVYNIDGESQSAAIRVGNYKLIVGDPGEPSGWIPPDGKSVLEPQSQINQTIWLFDVISDPNEMHDLSAEEPLIVEQLMIQLRQWSLTAVKSVHKPIDERGNPEYFNGTYGTGWC